MVTPDIKSPRDLAGKRIGIQGALSGSEFVITMLLRQNGLSRSDLTLVDMEPESLLQEMPGNIQGGYTWDPYLSEALDRGYRLLFTTADTPGMVPDVAAFHGSVLLERRAEIQGFVEAWFEAVRFWQEHPAPDLPLLYADRDRIQQVVLNLLDNAGKFTSQGLVELRANVSPEGGIQVSVQDSGPGVDPEDRERIFAFTLPPAPRRGRMS